jgi:hypothetical protein
MGSTKVDFSANQYTAEQILLIIQKSSLWGISKYIGNVELSIFPSL